MEKFFAAYKNNNQGELTITHLAISKAKLEEYMKSYEGESEVIIKSVTRKVFLEQILIIPVCNVICCNDAKMKYISEADGRYRFLFSTKEKAFFKCVASKIYPSLIERIKNTFGFESAYLAYTEGIENGLFIVGEY